MLDQIKLIIITTVNQSNAHIYITQYFLYEFNPIYTRIHIPFTRNSQVKSRI